MPNVIDQSEDLHVGEINLANDQAHDGFKEPENKNASILKGYPLNLPKIENGALNYD